MTQAGAEGAANPTLPAPLPLPPLRQEDEEAEKGERSENALRERVVLRAHLPNPENVTPIPSGWVLKTITIFILLGEKILHFVISHPSVTRLGAFSCKPDLELFLASFFFFL